MDFEMPLIEGLHLIAGKLRGEEAEEADEIWFSMPECCDTCKHMHRRGLGEELDDKDLFVCMLKGGPVILAEDFYYAFFTKCSRWEEDQELGLDEAELMGIMAYGQKK